MSLGNIDQVKLTDPNTGQNAFMSRDRFDTLKDNLKTVPLLIAL